MVQERDSLGIPLKICNNKFDITLLDSLNKRINFLNEIINKLCLKGIQAIHSRAEDLGLDINHREKYDVAVSRAVAPLNILVEYMIPFIKTEGICICMKGSNIEDEIENSKNAIKVLGGEITKVEKFLLPNTDINRSIVVIKKSKKTPQVYPRKAGLPSKLPL